MTDVKITDQFAGHEIARQNMTRKPCYRKDDLAMRPTYKIFSLILFTLTATIWLLCADFDSERIWTPEILFIFARVTFRSFKVIRNHWFWRQSKARMRLPI